MIQRVCTRHGRIGCKCQTKDHRPSAARRGYDQRWQAFRKRFLRFNPVCRCGDPATEVHHLDGKGPKGPRGFDPLNCEAMCRSCHSATTATATRGGG